MNILKDLKYEDLTEDLQLVHDICGEQTVIELIENLGGISIYIPKITRFDDLIFRYVRENRKVPFKKVAAKLGVSEQYIKNLVKKYN
jgi:hypothetical protein